MICFVSSRVGVLITWAVRRTNVTFPARRGSRDLAPPVLFLRQRGELLPRLYKAWRNSVGVTPATRRKTFAK